MAALTLQLSMTLAVAAGGAVGAIGRYGVGVWMTRWLGTGFPWSTLTVNVIGSLLMGLVMQAFIQKAQLSDEFAVFLTIGVLGGFTTFSAFSLDAVLMLQRGQISMATLYMFGSVFLSLSALVIGMYLARLIGA